MNVRSKRLWFLLLLPCVPSGFAVNYALGPSLTTFLVNFFAIMPLAVLASLSLRRVIARIGRALGAIIYVTFRFVSGVSGQLPPASHADLASVT